MPLAQVIQVYTTTFTDSVTFIATTHFLLTHRHRQRLASLLSSTSQTACPHLLQPNISSPLSRQQPQLDTSYLHSLKTKQKKTVKHINKIGGGGVCDRTLSAGDSSTVCVCVCVSTRTRVGHGSAGCTHTPHQAGAPTATTTTKRLLLLSPGSDF